jgi:hypothetical protein
MHYIVACEDTGYVALRTLCSLGVQIKATSKKMFQELEGSATPSKRIDAT